MNSSHLQRFDAPQDGRLSQDMLDAFERDGVIVLRDFVPVAACKRLRDRALELIGDFDPESVASLLVRICRLCLATLMAG